MGENVCTAMEGDGSTKESDAEKKEIPIDEAGRVLGSGFDSLYLSLTVTWKSDEFLKKLEALRCDAAVQEVAMPGKIEAGADAWVFNVEGYGSRGYAYLLDSAEFYLKVLDSLVPKSRPSVLIEIRSATLWQTGVIEAVDRILTLLQAQGAIIEKARASRVDPCMDILLPASVWTPALEDHIVKQADYFSAHKDAGQLTGMSIGRGDFQARLYDKPLEIVTKSKKFWMYDIWELKEVPPNGRVIRVEFQLRREVLRQLGIDTVWELVNHPRNLWAYCTERWLKFQVNADKHHTQQRRMPWWKTVQNSFLGGQRAFPLIRAKIVNASKIQIAQQMFGQVTSLVAIDSGGDIAKEGEINIDDLIPKLKDCAALVGMTGKKLHEKARRKIAKYAREIKKFEEAEAFRKELGLPVVRKQQDKKGGAA